MPFQRYTRTAVSVDTSIPHRAYVWVKERTRSSVNAEPPAKSSGRCKCKSSERTAIAIREASFREVRICRAEWTWQDGSRVDDRRIGQVQTSCRTCHCRAERRGPCRGHSGRGSSSTIEDGTTEDSTHGSRVRSRQAPRLAKLALINPSHIPTRA